MCGILVYDEQPQNLEYLKTEIKRRGPDHFGRVSRDGFSFESSVLSLRLPFTPQPVSDESSVLCYNGQIYGENYDLGPDTHIFWNLVNRSLNSIFTAEAEFAFVYYKDGILWFGRDRGGRRSLCYKNESGHLIVCSVGGSDFKECEGHGTIYKYSLSTKVLEILNVPDLTRVSVSRSMAKSSHLHTELIYNTLKQSVLRRCERPHGAGIALLFSGGLDCTIIAALLDECLPENETVELLNVAFENKRTNSLFDTPDRLLARESIKSLSKNRFRLVEIDVPYTTTQQHKSRVCELMSPSNTVMDLSIALAFYFAAQPQANCKNPRILFSGLGADELFAGYSRHTSAAQDPEHLAKELEMDLERLPIRNLGRDDRVISSWGREVRYPFLDNQVVSLACDLPLSTKTDGITTKIGLRQVAQYLNLKNVVDEKKRAIQFGARSAKMDPGSGNAKGHQNLE